MGVRMLAPLEANGLTWNWNLAYRDFKASQHEHLFIINNDVLLPSGVIDKLTRAMDPDGGLALVLCAVSFYVRLQTPAAGNHEQTLLLPQCMYETHVGQLG